MILFFFVAFVLILLVVLFFKIIDVKELSIASAFSIKCDEGFENLEVKDKIIIIIIILLVVIYVLIFIFYCVIFSAFKTIKSILNMKGSDIYLNELLNEVIELYSKNHKNSKIIIILFCMIVPVWIIGILISFCLCPDEFD